MSDEYNSNDDEFSQGQEVEHENVFKKFTPDNDKSDSEKSNKSEDSKKE